MDKIRSSLIYLSSYLLLILVILLFFRCCYAYFCFDSAFDSLNHNDVYTGNYKINGEPKEISNEEYANVIDSFKNETSKEIIVFPDNIGSKYNLFFETHYKFIYDYTNIFFGNYSLEYMCEVYLYCEYEFDTFNDEIQRIKKLKYNGKKVIFSSDLFNMPSYISIYNHNNKFEYIIVDEYNLSIYYVYLAFIDEYNVVFNNEIFPNKDIIDSDFPFYKIKDGGYSIYD